MAALFGPLHGGANEAVLRMLRRIGSKENIPAFIEGVKDGNEKLMGFGHRVYKNFDPRATIIKKACDDVFEVTGVNPLLEIAKELEKIALEDEYFIKRKLYPNVDFYSGPDLRGLPVPARDVHGPVRHRPDARLAGPVARAGAGQGAEDRPAQADLHRRPDPRLRAGLRALGPGLSARGVVLDLGNVLIDWRPAAAIAAGVGPAEAERFLAADDFDFTAFNHGPDSGGSWEDAEDAVRRTHPHWVEHALAYRANFAHSLAGEVPGSVDLVRDLHAAGVPMWGLTNWSHELWPHAPRMFGFLDEMLESVVVSGTEGVAKPDPGIYELVVERSGLPASDLVFVDDKQANVDGAVGRRPRRASCSPARTTSGSPCASAACPSELHER